MHTKDILAAALRDIGLEEVAKRAEAGFYHDYLSPLDLPELALANALEKEMQKATGDQKAKIHDLRNRVIGGDFDASKEESDEWAASPEGQDAFRRLVERR